MFFASGAHWLFRMMLLQFLRGALPGASPTIPVQGRLERLEQAVWPRGFISSASSHRSLPARDESTVQVSAIVSRSQAAWALMPDMQRANIVVADGSISLSVIIVG